MLQTVVLSVMLTVFKGLSGRSTHVSPPAELLPVVWQLPAGHPLWIEESMAWLLEEFGDTLLQPIVQPDDFIPAGCAGTTEATQPDAVV